VPGLPPIVQSPFAPGNQYVILNVSILNLLNQDIFFNGTDSLHERIVKAGNQYLVLEYSGKVGDRTETGLASYSTPSGTSDWWGVALNTPSFDLMAANQSIDGSMYFRIGPQFAPKTLICKSAPTNVPLFVVDLTRH
jgi:hypothetical protein